MSAIKTKLNRIIKSRKINVFLLFVAFAFLILVLAKLSKTYANTIRFTVAPVQVPEQYVVLLDSTKALDVSIKSSGFKLLKYYFYSPKIDIDFSKIDKVNDSVLLWTRNKGYSNLIAQFNKDEELVSVTPDSLTFVLDVNAVKYIPVQLQSDIKFSPGYDIENAIIVQPDSVKLIGPEDVLATISNIKTNRLVLDNIKTTIQAQIGLELPEWKNQVQLNANSVTVKAAVTKFTEGVIKVPVTMLNVPDSLTVNYFPKQLNVSFYTSLKNYKSVNVNDFKVSCDFNTYNNNTRFLTAILVEQPSVVKTAKLKTNRIEYIISK